LDLLGDALGVATTIVNARVFDGTTTQNWTSVRFADGLITEGSVVSAAQAGDDIIDAGGGTVLPGLIDAHVHLVPGALAQSLIFGVTTVLDMFSQARGRLPSGRGRCAFLGYRCHRARRAPVADVRPVPDGGLR
jgi:predicted amidohydrolase YtcJ